ncbi:MAG TPA: tRNA threonylcarbamoyladenosine dehydratase [Clostridia bacterium]|nr:tRNA threonylcarbamoyladenosine dehydratase [Clostridia bacterium]
MLHEFSRTELLIGKEALDKLKNSKVAVFGIGGVGTYAVEALVRSGVGKLVLIDDDCICLTNINRQLHATRKTIGKPKVEVMRDRILEINPKAEVTVYQKFYLPESAEEMIHDDYDYIIDAIDTVKGKVDLVMKAKERNIPIISCMGAGNKLDPTKFEVADIYKTSVCPLAKVMRQELRKRGIETLKVVYSREIPVKPVETEGSSCKTNCICPKDSARTCTIRRQIPGSLAFVPSVAGLIIAGEVVKDLIGYKPNVE